MEKTNAPLTEVNGFTALGKHIGIKKNSPDFAVIYSDKVCSAAALYTRNAVKGAPLYVTKEHLKDGQAQAIVVNSGISNVCTGKKGIQDAKKTALLVSQELGIKKEDVLVASTGLIGAYLPMDKIEKGIKGIRNELSKDSNVAEAILTTDLVKKEICVKHDNFTIAGVAKGSGMIHPNMATMLSFICTDAMVEAGALQQMLKKAVDQSFNMMTIDMDTSTSDMCIVLANGHAGKVDNGKFQEALMCVCTELARKIASDGEGATKLIEVSVINMSGLEAAKRLAKSIVSSNLVKCAAYGCDPNWGRILCAMGNSGVLFEESKVDVYFGGKLIVKNGVTSDFDYPEIKRIMSCKSLQITVDMKLGKEHSTAFGCDMTEGYIKINANYRT